MLLDSKVLYQINEYPVMHTTASELTTSMQPSPKVRVLVIYFATGNPTLSLKDMICKLIQGYVSESTGERGEESENMMLLGI